ncbi:RidA family protein [Paenibacillus radicibacter]|uniref:RidA family protein n=1 Tax=Paenibacillus radicibacter TaxID=2972488 RepID=UPI00280A6A2E|nr:RidA family protein [Paenibacillus radicibacter]
MGKEVISTTQAPSAIGPYSQAIRLGDMIFSSGQLGINPETGELAETIEAQTIQSLNNIKGILAASGMDMSHIVKTTVFLKDMNDFAAMNDVYKTYFAEPFPSRSTVEVARLPKDGLVEIEFIASL